MQAITDKTVTELIDKGLLHPETTKAYFLQAVVLDFRSRYGSCRTIESQSDRYDRLFAAYAKR